MAYVDYERLLLPSREEFIWYINWYFAERPAKSFHFYNFKVHTGMLGISEAKFAKDGDKVPLYRFNAFLEESSKYSPFRCHIKLLAYSRGATPKYVKRFNIAKDGGILRFGLN